MKAILAMTLSSLLLLAATATDSLAQTEQRLTVPLSNPGRQATLEVSMVFGSISIMAYDGDEIVIDASEDPAASRSRAPRGSGDRDDDDDDAVATDGFRRIPNTSLGITAEEYNNTVEISADQRRMGRGMRLDISVPRLTSVRARTVNGGALVVEGVSGEHELANVNGRITATDIAGSIVANTTNGELLITFTEIARDKAMSFTTLNGDVDVTFPANLAADLRINAGRGDVMTDFDFVLQTQEPVVERSENGERYRVRLEREVRALIGGGGPELTFKTFNGDIIIRRR